MKGEHWSKSGALLLPFFRNTTLMLHVAMTYSVKGMMSHFYAKGASTQWGNMTKNDDRVNHAGITNR